MNQKQVEKKRKKQEEEGGGWREREKVKELIALIKQISQGVRVH